MDSIHISINPLRFERRRADIPSWYIIKVTGTILMLENVGFKLESKVRKAKKA